MTTTAYRDPLERARETLAELTETLTTTLPALRQRDRVMARRAARVAFGGIGIAGALMLAIAAIANAPAGLHPFVLTDILVDTWLVACCSYVFVRLVGALFPRSNNPAPTGSLLDDVTRFAEAVASRRDGRFLGALSLVLPAIAVSLLTPLTLHLGVRAILDGKGLDLLNTRSFDEWISMSLLIVGHAHLALAFLAARFALRVARVPPGDLAKEDERGFKALFWTVLVSAIPGIILFALPPLLTAVTGLAFVPFLWIAIRRIALRERTALHDAGIAIV